MQLNAYNPPGNAFNVDWMQYVFLVNGPALQAQVQYWDSTAACACNHPVGLCNCAQPVVNDNTGLTLLPSSTIPAGWVFEIALIYATNSAGQMDANITGANFTVTDGSGNTIFNQQFSFDSSHQFPIQAFEVNIVGPDNGSTSTFSQGAGIITYAVSQDQLCIQGGLPDSCTGSGFGTAEQSNANYGPISSCCGSTLTQSLTHT